MKKRILPFLLTVTMMFSLCACTGRGGASQPQQSEKPLTGRAARIANNELVVSIGSEPETGFDSTTGGHGSVTKLFFSLSPETRHWDAGDLAEL